METKEFTIRYELAVAIINDDYSGLNVNDEIAIDKWFEKYNVDFITVAPSYEAALRNGEETTRFTECEITDLFGDCIDVIAYRQENKHEQ